MLSVLIPTYNYNVFPLVLELKKQADYLEINYEILVQDDLSQNFIEENNKINTLNNCSYSSNLENLGRGKNINLLCTKSKFDFVLIMEADALPEDEYYLKNYIQLVSKSTSVIFGGVKYPNTIPARGKQLRRKYGINRETKSLNHRLVNNYDFIFTWNLLLRKELFTKYPFPEFIHEYGYEDSIFIKNLRVNCISISHIENPLIHHNDEFSIDFIKKSERAVNTLQGLINSKKINYKDVKLSAIYSILKKLHLIGFTKTIYTNSKKCIINNLTSENPNLYLLDFYKLGYFCTIN